jgi:hypothetical protein
MGTWCYDQKLYIFWIRKQKQPTNITVNLIDDAMMEKIIYKDVNRRQIDKICIMCYGHHPNTFEKNMMSRKIVCFIDDEIKKIKYN